MLDTGRARAFVQGFKEFIGQPQVGLHPAFTGRMSQVQMQPDESITLEIFNKTPDVHEFILKPVELNLEINESGNGKIRHIAYERLIRDAIKGDRTLFVRRDELEQAWQWIDQIHQAWKSSGSPLAYYPAGSAGPM